MAQELAFAAPRTEEMTKTAFGVGVGVATGLVQGMVVKVAPKVGAFAPFLTWGSLIATPLIGIAGALFTRGYASDALLGVAAGSSGVLGYALPGLLPEFGLGKKAPQLTAEQRAALAAAGVKQLPPGAGFAPQRQQAQAKSSLEF